ncbi:MAG: protein kinase domain-containing protein [Bradymonadia bacterium]
MEYPQPFGKYTLLRRIAVGGMAEIFLARQAGVGGFEKDVVVKRLLPSHAESVDFVQMFLDEARIAANLTHPNIAQIYDLGEQDDQHYIAMEYVHGVDLRRLCSQGIAEGNYLPIQHALRIMVEVCDALAYAHARTGKDGAPLGIVHRDVSPTNILVTFEGGVKLVDFGIAKASNKLGVTKTGQIKGKYGYMSPEQVRGGEIDARSDIFAVGINLYEITLGRRLFRGDSEVDTLAAIENARVPSPRSISPDYPERLERIVLKALARDPEDRYPLVRALQMELEDFLTDSAMRSTPGMLSDYTRRLFHDQLDLEHKELTTRSERRPLLAPTPSGAHAVDAGDEDGERTEVQTRPDAAEATPDQTIEEPPPATLSKPPALPLNLTMEPSIDELIAVEESGILVPVPERPASPPVARPKPPVLPLADFTPLTTLPSGVMTPAPRHASSILMRPSVPDVPLKVTEVSEADVRVASPHRYRTALLFVLLLVLVLFGLQFLFVQDADRIRRRIDEPVSIAKSLPSAAPTAPLAVISAAPTEAPRLAILRLETEPPGARIVVNGNMLNAVTPASVQTLASQPSTVRFLLAGYKPWEARVRATPDGADVAAKLEKGKPEVASLRIESAPTGATLSMNGVPIGTTPVLLEKVAAGVGLTLRLEKPGHHGHVVLFGLQPGETREIALNLVPDTGPRTTATVNVESIPLGAEVRDLLVEDGRKVLGKTGNHPLKLTRGLDGFARLRASLPGFADVEADLDVKQPYYTLYLRFAPKPVTYGTLTVQGLPGVTVYLGSEEVGTTPLRAVKVKSGEHAVVLHEAATGARVEAKLVVDTDGKLERTVVRGDTPTSLRLQ